MVGFNVDWVCLFDCNLLDLCVCFDVVELIIYCADGCFGIVLACCLFVYYLCFLCFGLFIVNACLIVRCLGSW